MRPFAATHHGASGLCASLRTLSPLVAGSIPAGPTIQIKHFRPLFLR